MSAETKAALDAAIEAHIRDETESGAIITGYVLHAAYVDTGTYENGSTGYFAEYGDRQPFHVCVGLAHQLVQNLALDQSSDREE